jgi:hypothetical protein
MWTSILFYIIGMSFGCSYSLLTVDCIEWVKTSFKKRLIRAVIGISIAIIIKLTIDYICKLNTQ